MSSDGTPFTYAAQGSIPGVHEVLEHLLSTYPIIYQNSEGELIGCANEEASITLEPSSQIEISIAPFSEVARIEAAYEHFRAADRSVPLRAWGKTGECGVSPYA